jgi:hypothetical protein
MPATARAAVTGALVRLWVVFGEFVSPAVVAAIAGVYCSKTCPSFELQRFGYGIDGICGLRVVQALENSSVRHWAPTPECCW